MLLLMLLLTNSRCFLTSNREQEICCYYLLTPGVFLPPILNKKSAATTIDAATSSNSLKSKKRRGPSKKDLEMFKLFMKSFDDSDTDEDDRSQASSEASVSLFQDPAAQLYSDMTHLLPKIHSLASSIILALMTFDIWWDFKPIDFSPKILLLCNVFTHWVRSRLVSKNQAQTDKDFPEVTSLHYCE